MRRFAVATLLVLAASLAPSPAEGTAIPVPVAIPDERFVDWPTEVVIPAATPEGPQARETPVVPVWAPTSVSGKALAWPRLWAGETGVVSTYGPGYRGYFALPWPYGAGWVTEVCGPGGCVTKVSNDAGPERRLRRIADLDVPTFEAVCAVPWRMGLCIATVTVKRRAE